MKSQKKELYDYAKQLELIVSGCSEDIGSDPNVNRLGLLDVKQAAKEGKMGILLVKRLDRISSDTIKTKEILLDLKQQGIRVYSLLEGEICPKQQEPDPIRR